jgi:putative colanic acid biosynthesis acetyltransferase WcaF
MREGGLMSNNVVNLSHVPSPFSFWNKLARVAWNCVWLLLFRPSPRIFHRWRAFLLRLFGAKLGKKRVFIYPSCQITMPWKLAVGENVCLGPNVICYNIGGVRIGSNTAISQNVHLCSSSHDYTTPNLVQTFGEIVIEDQVWICADAFIGPGRTIGSGAVVGARAVVTKDVQPWTIVAGNPAKYIKDRVLKRLDHE